MKRYSCIITNQPASEMHHVFFGKHRKLSDEYSFIVPVSRETHELAHGRSMQSFELYNQANNLLLEKKDIQKHMAEVFCNRLGICYDITLLCLNKYANKSEEVIAYLCDMKERCEQKLQELEL